MEMCAPCPSAPSFSSLVEMMSSPPLLVSFCPLAACQRLLRELTKMAMPSHIEMGMHGELSLSYTALQRYIYPTGLTASCTRVRYRCPSEQVASYTRDVCMQRRGA